MAKYIKGLNKDAAPVDQPEGSYRYAKNILVNETAGAISNEPGTRFYQSLPTDATVIGTIETTEDEVILFVVNEDGDSSIHLYSTIGPEDASMITIFSTTVGQTITSTITGLDNDVDLKFSKKYPIEGTYKIDPNENLIIYFTDNFNPPRSLNVTRQQTSLSNQLYGVNPALSSNKNYIDRINLFPHSGPVPSISFNTISNGGALKSGTYYLFLAYVDQDFTQTNFVSYSLGVPIVEDDEGVRPIERYDGCLPDSQTGKSIAWRVTNLNKDYEFLRPVVVFRSSDKDGAPAEFAFKLNDVDITTGSSKKITFSGLEGYESKSVEEVIIDTVAYDTAKTLTQLDGVLYVGNLTGTKDIGYQKHANFIKSESILDTFNPFDAYELTQDNMMYGYLNTTPPTSITKTQGYRDVNNLSLSSTADTSPIASRTQRKGYTRDEVYAFYIAFVLNDGTMSYAYHIPGRTAIGDTDGSGVTGIGSSPSNNLDWDDINHEETDFLSQFSFDPGLVQMTQTQGQLFHFYDYSGLPNSNNMNFWQNQNEFYPNTDDYKVFDGVTEVAAEDLRGTNVRHHHMPSNSNPDRCSITNNLTTFTGTDGSFTQTYYFAVGDPNFQNTGAAENTDGGSNTDDNLGLIGVTSNTPVDDTLNDGTAGAPGFGNAMDTITDNWGNAETWIYQEPSSSLVGQQGWFVWNKVGVALTASSGCAWSTVTGVNMAGGIGDGDDSQVEIDQDNSVDFFGSGNLPGQGDLGTWPSVVTYGIFIWQAEVTDSNLAGQIGHEVRPLGVKFKDIKIPVDIADKVQGFRIYYAERKHSNRRILGQDLLKKAIPIADIDLSDCAGDPAIDTLGTQDDGVQTLNASEDFILSSGSLFSGEINSATFHDFYLLSRRNSLVPGTHTSHEYTVNMLSFGGPFHSYEDVHYNLGENLQGNTSYTAGDGPKCILNSSFKSFHIGTNYQQQSIAPTFRHYPLREKCKTYLRGNSIFDGRSLGFGQRIYNLGGESSIMLGYLANRQPNQGVWPSAFGPGLGVPTAPWHINPEDPVLGDPNNPDQQFYYENPTSPAQLQIHNLHAFKTDMYLSFDTQELIWTGYEVLGEDLQNFILNEDGSEPDAYDEDANGNATEFTTFGETGEVWGGDTYLCRHGYRITHRPEFNLTPPWDHKTLIYTICESTDNINFRHDKDKESAYFPGSPAKRMLDLKADVDLTKEDAMLYSHPYTLGVADIKPPMPYPIREADPEIFKTRVQRSAKADNTSLIDNYRVFLALQFKDLPRNRGNLWKLLSLNNLLYLHTEDSLFRTKGKQSLQMSDGTESFVGSGDIFAQDPDEIIQTKYGYGGTQSQWVSMVTKHGYFTLDYRNRRVFLFKDQLYDIGKQGMESWFQDNIPFELEKYGVPSSIDNPILGIGFHSEYDERYDRILLTKRDLKPTNALLELLLAAELTQLVYPIAQFNSTTNQFEIVDQVFSLGELGATPAPTLEVTPIDYSDTEYFESTGWTISYDVELNVWVSFHDYIPYIYSRHGESLISFTPGFGNVWVHSSEINRGRFYNTEFSTEFEFIYNSGKDADKIFYSFEYMVDVEDSHNVLANDHGFNSFYVYTTHQISDEQPIEYMINTRQVGNEWKINKFRDLAKLTTSNDSIYTGAFTGSNFGVPGANVAGTITTGVEVTDGQVNSNTMFNIDGMTETINNNFIDAGKPWNKQRKFRDKWIGIRLKYDNVTKKLINLYSTNVAAKKFYR